MTRFQAQLTQFEKDLNCEDLSRNRKPRLIARCWLASKRVKQIGRGDTYDNFRTKWMAKTYRQIHDVFDQWLPEEQKAYYNQAGRRSWARPHTKTFPQMKAWESLQKAPKALAVKFARRSREWGRHHLRPVWEACAAWCEQCTSADLEPLFARGINSRPDLESHLEKQFIHLRVEAT